MKDFTKNIKNAGLGGLIPTSANKESASLPKIRKAAAAMKEARLIGAKGRPKRADKDNESAPSAEKGTKPGEARKTYLVNIEIAEKLEAIAYWDRKTIKEVVGEAIGGYVAAYEKKNGAITQPKK